MMMEDKLKKILQLVINHEEGKENSETMPNKEEIDKNVEEILKMLHPEVNDPTSSKKSFEKTELASRIDNFHKGCQVIYGRYDHLMAELKKITSCDLESDSKLKIDCVSLEEYQILQGQLEDRRRRNNELETLREEMNSSMERVDVLTRDLYFSMNSESDTNQMLRSLHEENELLRSGNAEAFSRLEESRKHIAEFMTVMMEYKKQSGIIDRLNRENDILRSGNFVFVNKIQMERKAVADVREKADLELKLVHEELRSQHSKYGFLRDKNSKLHRINDNLKQELEVKVFENEALAFEIKTIEEQVLKLEVGISGLSKAFSELEAVSEENSGHILEQISVFSEKLKELKSLSGKYAEETISMMRDEHEKKREGIMEMSLTIKHLRDKCDNLCTYLSCLMIEGYPDAYNELRTFLSSMQT